jgi:hypothetical protein
MNYNFIIASQKNTLEETFIYKSLFELTGPNFSISRDVLFYGNNTRPLSVVYNEGLKKCKEQNIGFAIFVHDDVYLNCCDFVKRVKKYGNMYDVFGLAGNKSITIKEPVLWHLMSSRDNLRGCVAHGPDENSYTYTSFGKVPDSVVLIDGVFMVVNLTKLPESVKFDENNPAKFHFYDLMFSLDCCLNKVKVGVGDIPIIHNSPGLREMSNDWKQGQQYFLNKYKKYLNKTLTV